MRCARRSATAQRPLHYLAIPPSMFPVVIEHLSGSRQRAGRAGGGREALRPRPRVRARAQPDAARSIFPESSIFRIDHYLGKEAVQNLLYFRFANSFLEPIWNRNFVASVQITMAESIGVAGPRPLLRGDRRDPRRHAEPSAADRGAPGHGAAGERRRRSAARREGEGAEGDAAAATPAQLVRGQFRGYREEPGVAPDSQVETYAALRLAIDSWRWSGVPFYLRAGKCLPVTATEVVVDLRPPPARRVRRLRRPSSPITCASALGPDVAIALGAHAKKPGPVMAGQDGRAVRGAAAGR